MNWREAKIIAFDTETTGLDPIEDRIVQFAFEIFDPPQFTAELIGLCGTDGVNISDSAAHVHGLTNEMVAGKPSFDSRLPEILDFLEFIVKYSKGNYFLLGYNSPFDLAFLCAALQRCDLTMDFDPLRVVDPVIFARMMWKYGNRLEEVAQRLGIDAGKKHDAGWDAKTTVKVLLALEDVPSTLDELLVMQNEGIRAWEKRSGHEYRDTLKLVGGIE